MLKKFCVENFKAFNKKIEFNLGTPANYEFNLEALSPNKTIISKAIIYGFNGCGKSVLGMAIFDIVAHLTDNEKGASDYEPYLNLKNKLETPAIFEYTFDFEGSTLVYSYKKKSLNALIEENVFIDNREVIKYDFNKNEGFVNLKGAENLNLSLQESPISRVKYVSSNTILEDNHENNVFNKFITFVKNMLMFSSLEHNKYRGFRNGAEIVGAAIVNAGKVKDFEKFLSQNNIDMELVGKEINGEKTLLVQYDNKFVNFYAIASTGTKSLALFFYWFMDLEQASFVYMDEFDAFYHFELSENIVNTLKNLKKTQIIFTTHNTDLLSNDILRPDCFFWLDKGCIKPLNELTEKEIRKAHNLEKMFRSGAFNINV